MDADYLADVQAIDARYHLARMIAQGFNGGAQVIWDERNDWRAIVLAPTAAQPTQEDWLARVNAIHAKMMRAGLIPTTSGAVN